MIKVNIVPLDSFTDPVGWPQAEYLSDMIERSHDGGVLPEQSIKPSYDSDDVFDVDPSCDITTDPMLLAELAQQNFQRRYADALTRAANNASPSDGPTETGASPVNSAEGSPVSPPSQAVASSE